MAANLKLMHTTKEGVKVFVSKGNKPESPFDFRVHYQEPEKRIRTPKHIHLIIDLYMKLSHKKNLTIKLVEYLIDIMKKLKPETKFPPTLQVYDKKDIAQFKELNKYGEYSVEFIFVVTELIMIQEKTNYPTGTMNVKVFERFRDKYDDIFSVVSAATFK
ncbi:hypothetical protein HYV50_02060 [Candidatus Pacearchaeota archaeon]|nr:hypothetical protein [Candidatus Pacearchaeota archaeon]